MTTRRRPRGAEPAVQGELEMTAGDPAPGAPAPVPPADVEEPAIAGDAVGPAGPADAESPADAPDSAPPPASPAEAPAGDAPALDAGAGADDRLAEALEGLDRRVTFMIERYEELAARHRRTLEERRAEREALERLAGSGASPAELDARIRDLEADNDRLTRHAGFLEERIQGLLARVRYVIEA